MRTTRWALLLLLPLCLCLCACAASTDPLVKAEATDVPGLRMKLHAASASQSNVDTLDVALYFRYLDEPMLAAESRLITVKRDESAELAIVRALLDGPSAGHSDLNRLLPETVEVESVAARGGILFVTFNGALLTDDDVPDNWREDPAWQDEAPLRRALIIHSVVASLTEYAPYEGVQIMVHKSGEVQSSLRLERDYFLTGMTGLSDPLARDESYLLTPQNTAGQLLSAWQARDYRRLFNYVASADAGDPRPGYTTAVEALDALTQLSLFTTSGGSVSGDGARAVVSVYLERRGAAGETSAVTYPLPLVREGGVWKITYSQLLALMGGRSGGAHADTEKL